MPEIAKELPLTIVGKVGKKGFVTVALGRRPQVRSEEAISYFGGPCKEPILQEKE